MTRVGGYLRKKPGSSKKIRVKGYTRANPKRSKRKKR